MHEVTGSNPARTLYFCHAFIHFFFFFFFVVVFFVFVTDFVRKMGACSGLAFEPLTLFDVRK